MLTLNNINDTFSRIASAHDQLNHYGLGDPLDMAVSGTTHYPMLWVIPNEAVVSQGQIEYSLTCLIMDLNHKDESNKLDVWNDCLLIGTDIINELTHPDWPFDAKVDGTMKPFEERGDDEVAGVELTIKIKGKYTRDRCAIPQGSITRTFKNET